MKTTHKKQVRFRCDYCKKLIPKKSQDSMSMQYGIPFSGIEDRWYHFCNKNHRAKSINEKYQLKFELDA